MHGSINSHMSVASVKMTHDMANRIASEMSPEQRAFARFQSNFEATRSPFGPGNTLAASAHKTLGQTVHTPLRQTAAAPSRAQTQLQAMGRQLSNLAQGFRNMLSRMGSAIESSGFIASVRGHLSELGTSSRGGYGDGSDSLRNNPFLSPQENAEANRLAEGQRNAAPWRHGNVAPTIF